MLMADEVYQENIYNSSKPFVSARAALATMEDTHYKNNAEIVSFHTTSKGYLGMLNYVYWIYHILVHNILHIYFIWILLSLQ